MAKKGRFISPCGAVAEAEPDLTCSARAVPTTRERSGVSAGPIPRPAAELGLPGDPDAATYPDHPAGLILVSCGPRFAAPMESAAHVGGTSGAGVAAVLAAARDREAGADDWSSVIEPLLSVGADPVLGLVERLRIQTMDVNRHFEPEGFAMDLPPRLANVRCPTILIIGDTDPLVPPILAQQLIDALPAGVGRLAVKDASHRVLTDRESDAWDLIRSFVSDLR